MSERTEIERNNSRVDANGFPDPNGTPDNSIAAFSIEDIGTARWDLQYLKT